RAGTRARSEGAWRRSAAGGPRRDRHHAPHLSCTRAPFVAVGERAPALLLGQVRFALLSVLGAFGRTAGRAARSAASRARAASSRAHPPAGRGAAREAARLRPDRP